MAIPSFTGRILHKVLEETSQAYDKDIEPWSQLDSIDKAVYLDAAVKIRDCYIRSEGSPTIVCLCGSTRFSKAFQEANLRETLAGHIVLSIGCDFKSDIDLILAGDVTRADKERLDELHLRKIDLADEILVLNVGGYIGKSTRREIEYAYNHGKSIRYLEP